LRQTGFDSLGGNVCWKEEIEEADDASLEGSMDFDAGSNDTLDLDADELLAGP